MKLCALLGATDPAFFDSPQAACSLNRKRDLPAMIVCGGRPDCSPEPGEDAGFAHPCLVWTVKQTEADAICPTLTCLQGFS